MSTAHDTPPSRPSRLALWAAFAAVYFIWGSTYLGIRFAIETLPPFTMAAIRFLTAGVILFGWSLARGVRLPSRVHWRSAALVGMLLLVSGNGLLTWAEQFVPSGIAALIVGTVPLWMIVLDAARTRTLPRGAVWLGLGLGLVGIAMLVGPGSFGGGGVHVLGAMTIGFAAFSWAVGSLISRTVPQSPSTLQNVGMQMLVGGALLLVAGYGLGERIDLAAVSARSAWALVYLALAGGVVSYSAYVWLLEVSTPAKVATYAYVNPAVAVLLGWTWGGEALTVRVVLATVAIVVAVVLISSDRKPVENEARTPTEEAPSRKLARS